ncbi:hypothetical protein ACP275_06G141000 [Erythranthe tilingii]
MATSIMISSNKFKYFVVLIAVVMSSLHTVECVGLDVGGEKGWATPQDEEMYNDWASKNRFKVNDTLKFAYEKDSVLVVTEEEYEKCRSAHPIFFSNNGDTTFTLDRPGLFYFISGVSGHCQRGLKMVVKVLEVASPPQPAPDQSSPVPASAAAATAAAAALTVFFPMLVGVIFM